MGRPSFLKEQSNNDQSAQVTRQTRYMANVNQYYGRKKRLVVERNWLGKKYVVLWMARPAVVEFHVPESEKLEYALNSTIKLS